MKALFPASRLEKSATFYYSNMTLRYESGSFAIFSGTLRRAKCLSSSPDCLPEQIQVLINSIKEDHSGNCVFYSNSSTKWCGKISIFQNYQTSDMVLWNLALESAKLQVKSQGSGLCIHFCKGFVFSIGRQVLASEPFRSVPGLKIRRTRDQRRLEPKPLRYFCNLSLIPGVHSQPSSIRPH